MVLSQSLGYQCESFSHSVVYSICTIFIISTVPHHLTVNIFFCYIFTIDDNRKMAENFNFFQPVVEIYCRGPREVKENRKQKLLTFDNCFKPHRSHNVAARMECVIYNRKKSWL